MNKKNPVRIQRRRSKGWKMPPNTVCVDRSTKWGNPFITGRDGTRKDVVRLFRLLLAGYFCLTARCGLETQKKYNSFAAKNREKLRGKNLACWCPLNQPCHADALLEVANKE